MGLLGYVVYVFFQDWRGGYFGVLGIFVGERSFVISFLFWFVMRDFFIVVLVVFLLVFYVKLWYIGEVLWMVFRLLNKMGKEI